MLAVPFPPLDANLLEANPTMMDVGALLAVRDGTFWDSQRALIRRALDASGWGCGRVSSAAGRLD